MRYSPTSGYLSALAAVFMLVGCATTNGDAEEDSETPTAESPAKEKKVTDSDAPPAFEPQFDPAPDGGPSDPSGDPTPPGGDQCIDNDDPGSAENVAKVLPPTDDCDNAYKEVTGTMKGAVDVDFFKLSTTDKSFCSLDTDFEAQTAGTELCVFARCKNSTVDAVTGCAQGVAATSDIGMKGCCAAAPGKAIPTWDCSGLTDDDSADFFLRVKQVNGDKCLPYKVRYRY